MNDYDINIGIFETAALADQFDLGRVGRGFSSSIDMAEFIVHKDNDEWFTGIHQYCWRWFLGDTTPTDRLWQEIADDWRANMAYADLVEWKALKGPAADFVKQTFRQVRMLLFGGKVK